MKIVKVLKTTLASALATDGTTIKVQQFVDSNGEEVALADFGSFFNVVIKQGSKIEIIKCDGLTQSSTDDSAILSIATNGRAIPPKAPFTGSATGKSFQTGAELIVTNDPYTMSFFAQVEADNAFTGANTFTQFPKKLGSTTPVDDEDFVTLAHLNATVLGDAVVSAIKSSVTFGEAVTAGNPVYFKTSDQKWYRAYANNSATCIGVLLGIAQADADADEAGTVTRLGRDAINTGFTAGSKIYLTDAGGLDETSGSYIVELGTALASGSLDFNPKEGKRELYLSSLTGMIVPYAGDSVPSGFLACDGQLLNFADQPDLLSVIGTKYGLGAGVAFTVTAANDTVDITSHGYSNGQRFMLSNVGGALPAGLAADTLYYVVNAATNTFKLSLTAGGAAVDITGTGTGTHYLHTQFKVPDLRARLPLGKGAGTFALQFLPTDVTLATDIITVPSNKSLYDGTPVAITTSGVAPKRVAAIGSYTVDGSGVLTGIGTVTGNGQRFYVATQSSTNFSAGTFYYVINFTGSSFQLSATEGGAAAGSGNSGTLTGGAEVALPATMYAIRLSATTIKLAASLADAIAQTPVAIDLSTQGTGTHTITATLSTRVVGEIGGEEQRSLSVAEIPAHSHDAINDGSDRSGWSSSSDSKTSETSTVGGSLPHNVMNPFVVINYIIKT